MPKVDVYSQDVMETYKNLGPEDKALIDRQVNKLLKYMQNKYKGHNVKSGFGKVCALELLAKLGIWLNEEGR